MRVHFSYLLPIIDEKHKHRLQNQDHPDFACIKPSTLANLFDSMDEDEFNKQYLIVDCRNPNEYEGGHVLVNLAFTFLSVINYEL